MEVVMNYPVPWLFPLSLWTMSFEILGRLSANNRQFVGQYTHAELLAQDATRRLEYLLGGSK